MESPQKLSERAGRESTMSEEDLWKLSRTSHIPRCPVCGEFDTCECFKFGIQNHPELGSPAWRCRICRSISNYVVIGSMCKISITTKDYVSRDFDLIATDI